MGSSPSARSHQTWLWVSIAAIVAFLGLFLAAGWLALRWFDAGMSGVHVSENPKAARHLAESLGLQLARDDRVVYGELQSSFPDSGSYLVVATRTPADRDRILAASSMSCTRETPSQYVTQRSVDDHGPGSSATLVTCRSTIAGQGVLSANYDPAAPDAGTRVYVQASEM